MSATAFGSGGRLVLRTIDAATGEPVACRMHLKTAKGRVLKPKRVIAWDDHFLVDGKVTLDLPEGDYTFEIERGPEYAPRSGRFTMINFGDDEQVVPLKRVVDMAADGWWSGEMHIHRRPEEIELLMQAEDLHIAPVITWWNGKNYWQKSKRRPNPEPVQFDDNRFYQLMGGEDEREGGAVLFLNLREPLDLSQATRDFPPALRFIEQARQHDGAWIDAEKPFWWDFPVWLAAGVVDSMGLAHNHLARSSVLDNEAWGKPRDKKRFSGPTGNGRWTQEIYSHVLNSGLRIPPSAGSASGVLKNPVGYNRMYVFVGEDFNYDTWFEGLRAGKVIVTNGPLIRPLIGGKLPGHTFHGAAGETIELDVNVQVTTGSGGYLEIVKNGEVVHSVRLDEWAKDGILPPLKFDASGWFLVRVISEVEDNFRFASTGPYYVEIGDVRHRISRQSAQYFLDWTNERAAMLDLEDSTQHDVVQADLQRARDFWQQRVDEANAP